MSTYGAWAAAASCTARLDLPWTRDHADVSAWDAETMRAVCDGCPVVLDCLAAVDALDVTGGWWAGVDRDPHAFTVHQPPAWATTAPDVPAAGTTWVPVRSRSGSLLGDQGAFSLGSAA